MSKYKLKPLEWENEKGCLYVNIEALKFYGKICSTINHNSKIVLQVKINGF